jgi:hypothetical protein
MILTLTVFTEVTLSAIIFGLRREDVPSATRFSAINNTSNALKSASVSNPRHFRSESQVFPPSLRAVTTTAPPPPVTAAAGVSEQAVRSFMQAADAATRSVDLSLRTIEVGAHHDRKPCEAQQDRSPVNHSLRIHSRLLSSHPPNPLNRARSASSSRHSSSQSSSARTRYRRAPPPTPPSPFPTHKLAFIPKGIKAGDLRRG